MDGKESFGDLVDKLSQQVHCSYHDVQCADEPNRCFEHTIRVPHSFEDFRRSQQGRALQPLIAYLTSQVHHPALVCALLYVRFALSKCANVVATMRE